MKQQWKDKNVDLILLTEHIKHFFEGKNLGVVKKKLENGLCIEAFSLYESPPGRVSVKILGKPNDFSVEISACNEMPNALSLFSLLEKLGLGFLILKKVRSEELLNKLESEFWVFLNNFIEKLSYSSETI